MKNVRTELPTAVHTMQHFSTADGDRIRVECEQTGLSFADGLSLVVRRRPTAQMIDGVLTTDVHSDGLHELFARGETFHIRVRPAGGRETTVYRDCTLLSSSGKWIAATTDAE